MELTIVEMAGVLFVYLFLAFEFIGVLFLFITYEFTRAVEGKEINYEFEEDLYPSTL